MDQRGFLAPKPVRSKQKPSVYCLLLPFLVSESPHNPGLQDISSNWKATPRASPSPAALRGHGAALPFLFFPHQPRRQLHPHPSWFLPLLFVEGQQSHHRIAPSIQAPRGREAMVGTANLGKVPGDGER